MNKVNHYTRRYYRFIPNKEEAVRINEVTIEDIPCSGIEKDTFFNGLSNEAKCLSFTNNLQAVDST